MKTRNTILLPRAQKPVSVLGENIKLARLRRRFSAEQVAGRADISRPTLVSIEKGSPNVTIGAFVKVLTVPGLENDIMEVAEYFRLNIVDALKKIENTKKSVTNWRSVANKHQLSGSEQELMVKVFEGFL